MKKLLAVGVIVLFIGLAIAPSTSFIVEKKTIIYKSNNPPYVPSNPIPPNGSSNVTPTCLEWTGGDPDGDNVTYDVYFGKTTLPLLIAENINLTNCCPPGLWEFNTTYYWKVVAWDEHGASTEGPIWSFTTIENSPPYEPSNPFPEDGAKYVPVDTILNWTGGDPNPGDPLTYDVYFGVTNPPTLKSSNQTGNSYDPIGNMELFKKYYWYIVSWDSQGLSTSGQIWHFTTDPPPLPEVEIVNPREGYFNFSGIPLFPTVLNLLADTVSFGGFRLRPIQINATDEVDNSEDLIVKVYLNGEEQGNASYCCDWRLHEWFWTGRALGTYQLKVTTENTFGLKRSAEMKVWNFCFIP